MTPTRWSLRACPMAAASTRSSRRWRWMDRWHLRCADAGAADSHGAGALQHPGVGRNQLRQDFAAERTGQLRAAQ
ncbi:hypothetical protein G6F32_017378 [Rhizopus arrhizus]|nr:hypothetical protein G6F32_017378 [Rhizopus arrhizus]